MDQEQYSLMYRVEDTHWWYVGMRRICASLLSPLPERGAGLRILDAGCGTGGSTAWLAAYGGVVGADRSPEALRCCAERRLPWLAGASVQALPFPDRAFDLVTCFDVLYHLDAGDDTRGLRELRRVLSPGGHLLIRLPAFDWLRGRHDRAVHTRHRYTARELRTKLEDSGFLTRRITYANCFLFPLAAAKRLAEPLFPVRDDLRPPGRLPNALLGAVLGFEAWLVRRLRLPFGLSVLALAENPPTAAERVCGQGQVLRI